MAKGFGKLLFCFCLCFGFFSSVFAGNVDHFTVKLGADSIAIGEKVDLTIEVLDEGEQRVTDYEGTILVFSAEDPKAEFSKIFEENTYEFTQKEKGYLVIKDAVQFSKAGKMDINVYDFMNDSVFGVQEIKVYAPDKCSNVTNESTEKLRKIKAKIGKKIVFVKQRIQKNPNMSRQVRKIDKQLEIYFKKSSYKKLLKVYSNIKKVQEKDLGKYKDIIQFLEYKLELELAKRQCVK